MNGVSWTSVRSWVAADTLAKLSLAGLVLYVLLRLPYSVYYGRLGSSPEEVGLDYITLLAQSILGVIGLVLVLLVILALVFLIVVYGQLILVYFSGFRLIPFLNRWPKPNLRHMSAVALSTDLSVSDADFEEHLSFMDAFRQQLPGTLPIAFSTRIANMRALRAEAKKPEPSAAEIDRLSAELETRERVLKRLSRDAYHVARDRTRNAVWPAIVLVLMGLPAAAFIDAGRVENCSSSWLGTNGISGLRGAESKVFLVSADGATDRELGDRRLILLGRTAETLIFYACENDTTIRMPSESRIIETG